MTTILIVDDTPENLDLLVTTLSDTGFELAVATDGEAALRQLDHRVPDLILLDVMMPGIDGFETCRRIKAREDARDVPVVFMTSLSDTEDKVRGFDAGAVDFITKPFQHEEVLARVNTHLALRDLRVHLEQRVVERTDELNVALEEVERLKSRLEAEKTYLQEALDVELNVSGIVGESPAFRAVIELVNQVGPTDAAVLITGETGTGKELLARAIHASSPRSERTVVRVNCAALPENLIESELFGHEKGAFTGAADRREGRFELADGGTILLDEIGDLPLALQAKLLRVLQEGEFERLGGNETLKVDVRVIAATNKDLGSAIAERTFREDLYYRLNVFPIVSPPLRDRKSDIPLLVDHLIRKFSSKIGKPVSGASPEVLDALTSYAWPGNVRELENVIERAVILCNTRELAEGNWLPTSNDVFRKESATLQEVERDHILETLKQTQWRIRGDHGAAAALGLKPTTLEARIKKLGINRSSEEE